MKYKKRPELNASEQAALNFVDVVSDNNTDVNLSLTLFLMDKNAYFKKYEDDLEERGIESPEEITLPVVIIDALLNAERLVYADHSTESDFVLSSIDKLSNGKISQSRCYDHLMSAYKAAGRLNGISGVLYDSNISPMPFECINSQGFKLLAIDEGSDSYAFILLPTEDVETAMKYADLAGLQLMFTD